MHKTKLIFLLVLTDLLYHSHSAVMYGYSLTDSSVKFTLSMLSVSLDSSNRSSCLSFPHTYLLWLSQQIIEASWLVASQLFAMRDAVFLDPLFLQGGRNGCRIPWKNGQKYIKKKHCLGYMKAFILLYLCENQTFSAFICYIDHFINTKKDQKILPSEVDQVTLF